MKHCYLMVGIFCLIGITPFARQAAGQSYPTKPIRMITSSAGGGNDIMARIIGAELTTRLGQQVIIDNRSSGVIPGNIVLRAPADGYTLLAAATTFSTLPLMQTVPYDVARDFAPVASAGIAPNILIVPPSLAVKSVRELVAYAKARPGELNYSTSGKGASGHLAGELFKAMAGVDVVAVHYKGSSAAVNDVIGRRVEFMFPNASSVLQHIKSGRVRALAVTSAQPSELAPDLPTMAAALPGYESVAIFGIFAPAKTPPSLVDRLNREIVRTLSNPLVKERFLETGSDATGGTAQQFSAAIKADIARIGKIIKDAGIRED